MPAHPAHPGRLAQRAMLVLPARRVLKGRAAQPELKVKLDRRGRVFACCNWRACREIAQSPAATMKCWSPLIAGRIETPRPYLAERSASYGVAANAANGPLVVVCVGAPQ